jgi:Exo-beta-D-glucosaminidase Ig-fold domain/Glycosyl hydrolases family 2/Carbohydrate esterase, sialic acid-specific acetylesterase
MSRPFLVITLCIFFLSGIAQTTISLNSDNHSVHWKLCARDEVGPDSSQLFQPNYDTHEWTNAVVPGTTFTSFVAAGKEADPNYADNIYRVDKKKYDRDFWYRTEFASPRIAGGRHLWLHFRGINRKGEVFFNGRRLGLLDGFMQRGDYDVTGLVTTKGPNVLAVLVHWPGRPVANHASPTYISSDGWDWMPPVPGLLAGITDEVYLTVTGDVNIIDPWIRTETASDKEARLSLQVKLANHSATATTGVLTVNIQPGNIILTRQLTLAPNSTDSVNFDATHEAALLIHNPRLWWPNGYGAPNLYTCRFTFHTDTSSIKFGIRQYSYDTTGGVFHLWVNGRRIFIRGGNWGMSEYLLRCRGAEYDYKVLLHHEMHYNMIRNWIGSTTDEAFYDACDKYGIMVWDDFWLNSHPNLPDDVAAFNDNAIEKIKRIRNHPSVAVWCGDNESQPLPPLNEDLRQDVVTFDHGDRWYQPNSHAGALTGSGPWTNASPAWYFTRYPGGFGGSPGWGLRTEIGTAVFPNAESFKEFMPDSAWWPRNELWDKHFFGPSAANGGPDNYARTITQSYGRPENIDDFCRKAQLLNIETNKALYEGWQHHMWDDASGVMTWMSQSAYPSMVWQTYDYYYDLTGAYWGVRKACEPVHIQWSCGDNTVKIINTTGKDLHHLHASAVVYNMDGTAATAYGSATVTDAPTDTTTECFRLPFGPNGKLNSDLSPVQFIRLLLTDDKGSPLSDNFYWRSDKGNDYTALNSLPAAHLDVISHLTRKDQRAIIEATVTNPGHTVAFAIRVKATHAGDNKRILPALQNDNYFTLLPGESKIIHISFDPTLLRDGRYKLFAEAYNHAAPAATTPDIPLTLASPLQSNMVIQQNKPFTIWGHANPGDAVSIRADWLPGPVTVHADTAGAFTAIVSVPVVTRGDYHEHSLTVGCGSEMVTLSHLLIGEVWFCSGQSNMQFSMSTVLDSTADIAAAHHPHIRLFNANLNFSDHPLEEIGGSWVECSPKTVRRFSAVGYYFGRQLQQTLDVPVGIIFSGIGASAAQAYVPRPVLAADTMLDRVYLQPYLQGPHGHEPVDGGFSFEKVTRPFLLYNAMIYPFRHLSIRGFCWYQGESNRMERDSYTLLTQSLIRSWRDVFAQGDLPFYYVQVAPFFYDKPDSTLADYAYFREAQEKVAALPNTGMVITMDVGEGKNLHPINKKPVGERLAATALNREYGFSATVYRGPQYWYMEVSGRDAIIHFEPATVTGGLRTRDGKEPAFFTMAGPDHVFYPAQARIEGDEVIVHCDKVKQPAAVRYAFTNYPVTNVENGAGWPVVPFRTDNWPEKTPSPENK